MKFLYNINSLNIFEIIKFIVIIKQLNNKYNIKYLF